MRDLLRQQLSEQEQDRHGAAVLQLCGLAKAHGIVPRAVRDLAPCGLLEDEEPTWRQLVEHFGIELSKNGLDDEEDPAIFDRVVGLTRRLLEASLRVGRHTIDFDDMLYLPTVCGASFFKNDWVFVDEAQDVSLIQRAMLRRALSPNGGRLVAVGDPHQAIYGFRGADSDSLDNIQAEFDAIKLPLSISYRCPRKVVELAQQYVSHIESAPDAPEGTYQHQGTEWKAETINENDAILCRNNAPLVALAYRLIREGKPVRLLGRDIGAGLVSLIKRLKAKSLQDLDRKLEAWKEHETEKLLARQREDLAAGLNDKVETLRVFMDVADPQTVPGVIDAIYRLFSSSKGTVLSTVHKAKGMEWDTVYLLNRDALMPSRWARQEWQKRQEINLIYVALTRAKSTLVDITTGKREE
jgi:superfamily I DNA/RNA helicase